MVGNTSYNIYKALFNNTKIIFNRKTVLMSISQIKVFFFFSDNQKEKVFQNKIK